jgi:hypothetical protein
MTNPGFKSWQEIEDERDRARRKDEEKQAQEALRKAQQRGTRLDSYDAQKEDRSKAKEEALTKYDPIIRELLGTFASIALKPSLESSYSIEGCTDHWGDHIWSVVGTVVQVALSNCADGRPGSPVYVPCFTVYAPWNADAFDMKNYRLLAETIHGQTELKVETRRSARLEVEAPRVKKDAP